MQENVVELDVRDLLEEGRSPLPLIVNTVESLEDGQKLRLLTSWEPVPLYEMLGNLGFDHASRQESEDLWVVDFTRTSQGKANGGYSPPCIL